MKFGLGTLKWPLETLLHTDMNAIELAFAGHEDMIQSIFGVPNAPTGPGGKQPSGALVPITRDTIIDAKNPPKDARGNPITLTPALFDGAFKGAMPKFIREKVKKGDKMVAMPVSPSGPRVRKKPVTTDG